MRNLDDPSTFLSTSSGGGSWLKKHKKKLTSRVTISGVVKIRLINKERKTLLKTKVREDIEERTIKRDIKRKLRPLQIKWKRSKIVHLHCLPCGNSWGRNQGLEELNTKFDVKENIVKCKRCGGEWRTGGR